MDPSQATEKSIFSEALGIESPSERVVYVDVNSKSRNYH